MTVRLSFIVISLSLVCSPATADIFRWDTDEVIPGTEGIDPVPGAKFNDLDLQYAEFRDFLQRINLRLADFSRSNLRLAIFSNVNLASADLTDATIQFTQFSVDNLTPQQIYSTKSYQEQDLRGVDFRSMDLSPYDFSGQDLSHAYFYSVDFNGTDFTGANLTDISASNASFAGATLADAIIERAFFGDRLRKGHLYSTASYKQKNLRGIGLSTADLSDWDFSDQNLSEALIDAATVIRTDFTRADLQHASMRDVDLSSADLTDANLSFADLRGSVGLSPEATFLVRNAVLPDFTIDGLNLGAGEWLSIARPRTARQDVIRVNRELRIDEQATLELSYSAVAARPPAKLSVPEDIPVNLAGTLRVRSITSRQVAGVALDLFDWEGEVPANQRFTKIELPAGQWDLDSLYTTGIIRLIAVGERGDMNADGVFDSADIDQLSTAARLSVNDQTYDIDLDDVIDRNDVIYWVHELKSTYFGDADLDGEFDSGDLVSLFRAGEFEDDLSMNSGWATGDFDGDGDFGTGDLVAAFIDGGYDQGPRPASKAIPEPTSFLILSIGLIGFAFWRRLRPRVSWTKPYYASLQVLCPKRRIS